MKKYLPIITAILLTGTLFFAIPAFSLEFQWKFIVPDMDTREKAVQVYEQLSTINGVYDITINMDTYSLMLFFDDDRTDEEALKKVLNKAGFPVTKMMLLKEPREGVMN